MIRTNQKWFNDVVTNGMDINSLVSGTNKITQQFGVLSGIFKLSTRRVLGAKFVSDWHSGIDFGMYRTTVNTPGVTCESTNHVDHIATFQLYGVDLRMGIQHFDP